MQIIMLCLGIFSVTFGIYTQTDMLFIIGHVWIMGSILCGYLT